MQNCNRRNEESKRKVVKKRKNEEQEYHHKRKKAHKIIRNKKKLYNKNVIESIEEDQKYNTRKMYQTIKQFKKAYQYKFNMIRNEKGEMAMNTKERAEISKEYFDKLLKTRK